LFQAPCFEIIHEAIKGTPESQGGEGTVSVRNDVKERSDDVDAVLACKVQLTPHQVQVLPRIQLAIRHEQLDYFEVVAVYFYIGVVNNNEFRFVGFHKPLQVTLEILCQLEEGLQIFQCVVLLHFEGIHEGEEDFEQLLRYTSEVQRFDDS
jgi:hypothetical protein